MNTKATFNAKKRTLTLEGDPDINRIVLAFLNPQAVVSPKINAGFWKSIGNKLFPKIVLDLNHNSITKEVLLRFMDENN